MEANICHEKQRPRVKVCFPLLPSCRVVLRLARQRAFVYEKNYMAIPCFVLTMTRCLLCGYWMLD